MKKNVGGMDRTARLIVGPLLVLTGIAGYAGMLALAVGPLPQALTSVAVFLIGTILLVTGLVQKCPLNRVLGVNTYRRAETGESDVQAVPSQK
ncbi:Protein of unknown function [Halogranum amylolyticum]|uniref:Inner membrane protein YgaP-like transmembrane domain-containing protein n=1 Tax=Halogranum amylolyticum TaxID=660520 RepID=A0A1H8PU32_9EURY|nr:DUF2892 domain-containing protein [Halogranum amylolyticum]SEO45532.1 Protein of unknown function [Halogranum amylolyticum]